MQKLLEFLTDLRSNNNKTWFDANRDRYDEALARYKTFAQELITEVAKFDTDAAVLTPRECTYRIYRDLRFSKDKLPYKTALGVYICRGGKKTEYAGYYVHFEPEGDGGIGCFMTAGIYMPAPFVLRSIREEIIDNGDAIKKAINSAKGFRLNGDNRLKKNPKDFPEGSGHDDLLRQRDLYIERPFGIDYISAPDLARRVAGDLKATYPFIQILNRAVQYAYEENS